MNVAEFEQYLRSLLKGEYCELSLSFNQHAAEYIDARQAIGATDEAVEQSEHYYGSCYASVDWVSDAEKERAKELNSVWTLQWYPNTPVGFNCIGASSIQALVDYLKDDEA